MFDFLLVDGYNIIHDWKMLKDISKISLEMARDRLVSMLANYQGYKDISIIVVFDAHKISSPESIISEGNVVVVYTSEFETADAYIERTASNLRSLVSPYRLAVATSDFAEQLIIMGKGAIRLSAKDLLQEIGKTEKEIRQKIEAGRPIKNNQLLDILDEETAALLDKMRLDKRL